MTFGYLFQTYWPVILVVLAALSWWFSRTIKVKMTPDVLLLDIRKQPKAVRNAMHNEIMKGIEELIKGAYDGTSVNLIVRLMLIAANARFKTVPKDKTNPKAGNVFVVIIPKQSHLEVSDVKWVLGKKDNPATLNEVVQRIYGLPSDWFKEDPPYEKLQVIEAFARLARLTHPMVTAEKQDILDAWDKFFAAIYMIVKDGPEEGALEGELDSLVKEESA